MDPIWLVLFFPILGACLCAFLGANLGRSGVGALATGLVGASFLVALQRLWGVLAGQVPETTEAPLWQWLDVPLSVQDGRLEYFSINFTALVDPLSLTMLCVITGVGCLIHWYSTEYMADDADFARFFTYLNIFVAAMTLLVLANNMAVLLIGWAGVGFASWALIGFWYKKPSAVVAARKAFVINTIGDVGLMIAIFISIWHLRTTDYSAIALAVQTKGHAFNSWAWLVAGGLLLAAYAKSAQWPMHTWLPDAMEGPTPVSALIHAATMVTAGVYLLVRCQAIFANQPEVSNMVAIGGLITALYGGICALTQNDLKRVLAYSTMSQLGYMFLAIGVGAYTAAIFHLVTHAFFKALLFLAAGIVIHAAHGEQDMRRLGGLASQLPFTTAVFAIGSLALAGVPLTAGYFSKEAILASVQHAHIDGAQLYFVVGALTAVMTAYYIGRAFFLTFFGGPKEYHDLHRPAAAMVVSCAVLAALSLAAGWGQTAFTDFMHLQEGAHHPPDVAAHIISLCVLAAIGAAYWLHGRAASTDWAAGDEPTVAYLRSGLGNDELFLKLTDGLVALAGFCYRAVDYVFCQWLPGLLGKLVGEAGKALAETQSGQLRHYLLIIFLAVTIFLLYVMLLPGGTI